MNNYKNYRLITLIVLQLFIFQNITANTILSVRLIKAKATRSTETPVLLFSNSTAYSVVEKDWYNGENDFEIFFEIETKDNNIPLEIITISAKGVEIIRAIVGRTDVSFEKIGDNYKLTLVNDLANGRHVQTAYQNPNGGPFMWIYHNWEIRKNGNYLETTYPEKAITASLNYQLACQEMLRLMGDMNGINQKFKGELILLNCESSAPRGHLDFPVHWHLQHWEHDFNKEFGVEWRKKQYIIPHYYVNEFGKITSNKQTTFKNGKVIENEKHEYLQDQQFEWKDSENNLIFKQEIKNGSLNFIKPNSEIWNLEPDENGGDIGIWIKKNGVKIAKASSEDNGQKGITEFKIDYYKKGKIIKSWSDTIKYDPYGGKL